MENGDGFKLALQRRDFLKFGAASAGAMAAMGALKSARAQSTTSCGTGISINVRNTCYNVVADGIHDDTAGIKLAIGDALAAVNSKPAGIASFATVHFPPGTYVLTSAIGVPLNTVDTNGKGIRIIGEGAVFLLKGTGYYAFEVTAAAPASGDVMPWFRLDGCWFYTAEGSSQPNGIRIQNVFYATIEDCFFHQLSDAVTLVNGSSCAVVGCKFWGCNLGVLFSDCRDSAITDCYSWGSRSVGFRMISNQSNSSGVAANDGGCRITDCIALGGGDGILGTQGFDGQGIHIRGMYTPHISNVVLEYNKVNIQVENSQYGIIENVWSGPCKGTNTPYAIFFSDQKDGLLAGLAHVGWVISNINTQNPCRFQLLQESTISGFLCRGLVSPATDPALSPNKYAALTFESCFQVQVNAMVRNVSSSNPDANSISCDGGCWGMKLNGGFYEKPIIFLGSRQGWNVFNGPEVVADIDFRGGILGNEVGTYHLIARYDQHDPKYPMVTKTLRAGRCFPVQFRDEVSIAPGANLKLDCGTQPGTDPSVPLLEVPDNFFLVRARIMVTGGYYVPPLNRAFGGATIDVLRSATQINATIVQKMTLPSPFDVTIEGDATIVVTNKSQNSIVARFYLMEYEKLNF